LLIKPLTRVDYWLSFSKLIDSNSSPSYYTAARLLVFWYGHPKICLSLALALGVKSLLVTCYLLLTDLYKPEPSSISGSKLSSLFLKAFPGGASMM